LYRFQPVSGLAAFDLDTFLAMAQRSRKWQCPTSGFNGTVHDVQVDAFTDRILAQLKVRRLRETCANCCADKSKCGV